MISHISKLRPLALVSYGSVPRSLAPDQVNDEQKSCTTEAPAGLAGNSISSSLPGEAKRGLRIPMAWTVLPHSWITG